MPSAATHEALSQEEVQKITEEFKNSLKKILGKKFYALILFGSYARKEAEAGSDIDLLVLTTSELSEKERREISRLASALSLKYDTVISCVFYLVEQYETWETPFLSNVKREGLRL